jgi:hypothetical protein
MLVCEVRYPGIPQRFTYAARNESQAYTERKRLGFQALPVHVWEWNEFDAHKPELVREFDL